MWLSPEDFAELERRVADRDEAAFHTLQHAYAGLVHRFVSSKTADQRLASDLTGDIFRAAWEKCDRYPWRDFSFHVWLLRVARQELARHGIRDRDQSWLDHLA